MPERMAAEAKAADAKLRNEEANLKV